MSSDSEMQYTRFNTPVGNQRSCSEIPEQEHDQYRYHTSTYSPIYDPRDPNSVMPEDEMYEYYYGYDHSSNDDREYYTESSDNDYLPSSDGSDQKAAEEITVAYFMEHQDEIRMLREQYNTFKFVRGFRKSINENKTIVSTKQIGTTKEFVDYVFGQELKKYNIEIPHTKVVNQIQIDGDEIEDMYDMNLEVCSKMKEYIHLFETNKVNDENYTDILFYLMDVMNANKNGYRIYKKMLSFMEKNPDYINDNPLNFSLAETHVIAHKKLKTMYKKYLSAKGDIMFDKEAVNVKCELYVRKTKYKILELFE